MRLFLCSVLSMLAALTISEVSAAPACTYSRYNLCDDCAISQSMTVKSGSACSIQMHYDQGAGGVRITRRPSKGTAGTSANSYAYKAPSGFKGNDSFGVEVKYRKRDGSAKASRIEVTVDVF